MHPLGFAWLAKCNSLVFLFKTPLPVVNSSEPPLIHRWAKQPSNILSISRLWRRCRNRRYVLAGIARASWADDGQSDAVELLRHYTLGREWIRCVWFRYWGERARSRFWYLRFWCSVAAHNESAQFSELVNHAIIYVDKDVVRNLERSNIYICRKANERKVILALRSQALIPPETKTNQTSRCIRVQQISLTSGQDTSKRENKGVSESIIPLSPIDQISRFRVQGINAQIAITKEENWAHIWV